MSFGVNFITGALQRQLDNWSAEDAAIGAKIEKIGEKLVEVDDNATDKINKLQTVAGLLQSKYGVDGIYQLSYAVDKNAIDFSKDANFIADQFEEFDIPDSYIENIANPYQYLGQATQNMYEADTNAYNQLYTNLNAGNKTIDMLVPKRDFTKSYDFLNQTPSLDADPPVSQFPGKDKSDFQNTAYQKLAYLTQFNIPLSEAGNVEKLGEYALNAMEMNLIKGDTAQADSAEDILQGILINAATDDASIEFLLNRPREEILERIENLFGITGPDTTATSKITESDIELSQRDSTVGSLIKSGYNVIANENALSNYQQGLPRVNLNFDTMSNNEVSSILSSVEQGTIIQFISNGQTYFVEF